MSGLLSGILTAVAIVATVVSGGTLGIVAGALMAASYASSQGWIKGSIGKFFNSSTGHYLTMAVGLASAATSIYANMTATAASSSSSAVTAANQAAESGSAASGAADMAAGNASLAAGDATLSAAPTVSGTAAQTMAPGSLSQYAGSLDEGGSLSGANGLSQAQIATANANSAAVSKTLGFDTNAVDVTGKAANVDSASALVDSGKQQASGLANAQQSVNAQGSTNDIVNPNGGATSGPTTPSQMAQTSPGFNGTGPATPPTMMDKAGGMLSSAGKMIEAHPGLATVAGNALSGMAQGASQQKMMQEQIAAQQWGNMQWQDPTQVAKLNAAAAQPINVPVGYLNRAAAVRNMMNGSTSQMSPLQGQAMAPVGMASGGAMAPAAIAAPGAGLAQGAH